MPASRPSLPARGVTSKSARHARDGGSYRARRVLFGQLAVFATLGLAIFLRELPGLAREIRIWRMVGFGSGARHPR
ncbi:hypothetical protein [Streptomyces spirodelae]|uniref:Uncharacterized protein n=1 Tax=Streptomyces spirodelae TaxID=2812904 RepID=A0ABS3WVM2_9ACTN|nr:hypothetical protein [Streptomyces spirodelae]MBO8187166.1 hypothetical protein [Streptomyces spirodelae]